VKGTHSTAGLEKMRHLFLVLMLLAAPEFLNPGCAGAKAPPEAPQEAPKSCLRSGPMLGASEIQETQLWLQTHRPCRVQIGYWPEKDPAAARLSREIQTTAADDHIAHILLPGLRFGTRYAYDLYLDGERIELGRETVFQTQPMWRWRTDPPTFRVAIGSCAYVNDPPFDRPGTPYGSEYRIFETIAEQRPDLMLWLGDNVYYREADWLTEAGMRRRFAHTRALPELQRLLSTTHHYATWDDHDYGPNNSDRTFRMRPEALEIFADYWANPPLGTSETAGVFSRFEWGDVEFFLLDGRYHRTPNRGPPSPEKQMFGKAQMRWLKESLVSSNATFKIVASGSQLLNPLLHSPRRQELWTLFPHEQKDFLDFLAATRVEGVVFLSGDRHHAELLKIERPGLYPLYEFTSSSLTAGSADGKRDANNPARVPGTLVTKQHNFGLIEVAGPAKDRVLTLRTLDTDGKELWRYEIRRSHLAVPEDGGQ